MAHGDVRWLPAPKRVLGAPDATGTLCFAYEKRDDLPKWAQPGWDTKSFWPVADGPPTLLRKGTRYRFVLVTPEGYDLPTLEKLVMQAGFAAEDTLTGINDILIWDPIHLLKKTVWVDAPDILSALVEIGTTILTGDMPTDWDFSRTNINTKDLYLSLVGKGISFRAYYVEATYSSDATASIYGAYPYGCKSPRWREEPPIGLCKQITKPIEAPLPPGTPPRSLPPAPANGAKGTLCLGVKSRTELPKWVSPGWNTRNYWPLSYSAPTALVRGNRYRFVYLYLPGNDGKTDLKTLLEIDGFDVADNLKIWKSGDLTVFKLPNDWDTTKTDLQTDLIGFGAIDNTGSQPFAYAAYVEATYAATEIKVIYGGYRYGCASSGWAIDSETGWCWPKTDNPPTPPTPPVQASKAGMDSGFLLIGAVALGAILLIAANAKKPKAGTAHAPWQEPVRR